MVVSLNTSITESEIFPVYWYFSQTYTIFLFCSLILNRKEKENKRRKEETFLTVLGKYCSK